ncbi:MAG: sigma factor-like helix-turn-helix DNA-binding protein [Mycobacteriales bacterium]
MSCWSSCRGGSAAIVLRYFDDLSETQTADLLGCSVGTIRSQTARALAHLRALASDPPAGPSTSSGGRREH